MKLPLTLLLALAANAAWPQSPSLELADAKGTIRGTGADSAPVGYTIRVPKGANLHRTGEVQDVYSSRYNSFVSWTVQIEKSPVRTLEDAIKESTIPGRLFKPEGSAVAGGFQVRRQPTDSSVVDAAVWTYKVGDAGGVRAQCSGPAKALDALAEMCATLQVGPPGAGALTPK
jgi:hypothetical protein